MVEPVPEVVTPLVGLHVGVGQTLGEKMVHTESFSWEVPLFWWWALLQVPWPQSPELEGCGRFQLPSMPLQPVTLGRLSPASFWMWATLRVLLNDGIMKGTGGEFVSQFYSLLSSSPTPSEQLYIYGSPNLNKRISDVFSQALWWGGRRQGTTLTLIFISFSLPVSPFIALFFSLKILFLV